MYNEAQNIIKIVFVIFLQDWIHIIGNCDT